jgi:hypothetical protein
MAHVLISGRQVVKNFRELLLLMRHIISNAAHTLSIDLRCSCSAHKKSKSINDLPRLQQIKQLKENPACHLKCKKIFYKYFFGTEERGKVGR